MIATSLRPSESASQTQRVVLHGITWDTYTRLLTELGNQRSSRLAYDQGILEITMPSEQHETYKKLLERLIEALTEELDLPTKSFGSTTLNRDDLAKGAEPDSCYYIQNCDRLQGRTVNLEADPPPDLVLEIDISSPSSRRMSIYQTLGVPEIWRYSNGRVEFYQLQAGAYQPCAVSPTFSIVSSQIVNQFLQQAATQDDTRLVRSWRQWIRQHL
jgi:Uma2 family endonuclease